MANVYFANSINDKIAININNGLQNFVLDPRSTTDSGGNVTAVNCTAIQVPSARDEGADKFGTGGGSGNQNTIRVIFTNLHSDAQEYQVTTKDLSGQDLYIYVFDGSLAGQDQNGRAVGFSYEGK